ncbi:hypothetical protein ACI2KV_21670 [Micromonospora chokoriensis]
MPIKSLIRASKWQFACGAVMWACGAVLMQYAIWSGATVVLFFVGLMASAAGAGIAGAGMRMAAKRQAASRQTN